MNIYFVRHQAAGVLWECPLLAPPSAEQLAAITAVCEARHGAAHPKTDEPYWAGVVAIAVLGDGDMPATEQARDDGAANMARIGLPPPELSGVASVQNPRE
jgi:hypothetical protein